VLDWIEDHQAILWTLSAASLVTFLASLVLVPMLVVRIPADYFAHPVRPRSRWADRHPVIRLTLRVGKNVLGGLFVLAGIAMLVLPGQGLLTMLIGFLMLDGPGKYPFEKWLVARKIVRRPINWMRARSGHAPLEIERGPSSAP
jgi:hypothetical protein